MHNQQDAPAASGAVYEELRPLMFSIAYRMLGSVSEAEDVVQEAFLRFHRATMDGTAIESPKAFLATVTTRLAIDTARSARVRRETYVGPWLPEPLVISQDPDPADIAEMNDSLSLAFLALLQRLSPVERAVFVLREVFDYGYDEIAGIVQKSEDNCRQIFARARKRIGEDKPRFDVSLREKQELAARFFDAAQRGKLDSLVRFLAADAVFYGDGGGKAHAYRRPVVGSDRVGKALQSLFKAARMFNASVRVALVNGQPGALSFDADGRLVSVLALDIAGGAIQTVRSIVNPDKLAHLGFPVSDAYNIKRDDA
ncbi:MAG TPA: RNA polymerase sigma-70 factor [Ktedonobacterales bacterium]|nr:RNA polymerase sigma-70 factor [Ktedonobacterales bacterium]